MKISHFIHQALFDPSRGYYRTKNPIGENFDFITAPEISQVFGELIAAYLLQISSTKNSKISLVEMGAGKGTLLHDILLSITKLADKKIPQALAFLRQTSFSIIEINEVLKKIQQETLREFSVNWFESFEEFLAQQVGEIFFISNELFDCYPIDQFVKTDAGWCERVILGDREKKFSLADFDLKTHQFVENLIGFKASQMAPFGSVFEHSESAESFMKQLCTALKKCGGIAVNFDYGYFENEFANTLQAVKNHQKIDVLNNAGEADITALVNFSSLEKIAKNFDLNSSLISQREFFLGLGIEERRKNLVAKNPQKITKINSAINRLIAPDQMGELFKCHIIWSDQS